MFSGDKERDQWYEMGYYLLLHDQIIRVNFFIENTNPLLVYLEFKSSMKLE